MNRSKNTFVKWLKVVGVVMVVVACRERVVGNIRWLQGEQKQEHVNA